MVASPLKPVIDGIDYLLRGMDTFHPAEEKIFYPSEFESSIYRFLDRSISGWASYQARPVLRADLDSLDIYREQNPNFLDRMLYAVSSEPKIARLSLSDASNPSVSLDVNLGWLDESDAALLEEMLGRQVIVGGLYSARAKLSGNAETSAQRAYPAGSGLTLLLDSIGYRLHFISLPDYSAVVVMPGVKLVLPDGREF